MGRFDHTDGHNAPGRGGLSSFPVKSERGGQRMNVRALLLLLAILAFGSFLRLYHIGTESLWYDEIFTVDCCSSSTLARAIIVGNIRDNNPPVHHLAVYLFLKLFGETETAARLPSAIAGILAVPLLFQFGRYLYSVREGLVAAALLAVLWAPVSFSQEARAYSFLLLFSLLTMYLWKRIVDDMDGNRYHRGRLVLYVCAAIVCAYTHYFGVLIVGLQGTAMFLLYLRRWTPFRRAAVAYLVIAAALLPWVPLMQNHAAAHREFWIARPGLYDLLEYFQFAFNKSLFLLLAVLPLYGYLLYRAVRYFSLRRYGSVREFLVSPDMTVLLWLAVPVALIYLKSLVSQPLFLSRYLIISLPALYLLLARSVALIPSRVTAQVLIAALVVGAGTADLVFRMNYYAKPQKQQWREAVQYLLAHDNLDGKTVIVGHNSYTRNYYFRQACTPKKVLLQAGGDRDIQKYEAFILREHPKYVWYLYGHRNPGFRFMRHMLSRHKIVMLGRYKGAAACLFERCGPEHAKIYASARGKRQMMYLMEWMIY